jgi:hypothetical protein
MYNVQNRDSYIGTNLSRIPTISMGFSVSRLALQQLTTVNKMASHLRTRFWNFVDGIIRTVTTLATSESKSQIRFTGGSPSLRPGVEPRREISSGQLLPCLCLTSFLTRGRACPSVSCHDQFYMLRCDNAASFVLYSATFYLSLLNVIMVNVYIKIIIKV